MTGILGADIIAIAVSRKQRTNKNVADDTVQSYGIVFWLAVIILFVRSEDKTAPLCVVTRFCLCDFFQAVV